MSSSQRTLSVYEIRLTVFQQAYWQAEQRGSLYDFITLATLSRHCFNMAVDLLWQELPSIAPLLHVLPDDVIKKQLINEEWIYTSLRIPTTSELSRLYLYAPHIRAIRAEQTTLHYASVGAFNDALKAHCRTSRNALLPRLNRLQLFARGDPLIQNIHLFLHDGLRILQLPHYDLRLQSTLSYLVATPPSLESLVYVDLHPLMQEFAKSLHLFSNLRNLTVSILEADAMQAIASLPYLESLGVVIYDERGKIPDAISFTRRIPSFKISLYRSLSLSTVDNNGIVNNPFDAAINILRRFPVPCDRLTVEIPILLGGVALADFVASLADHFNISDNHRFSSRHLRRLSVDVSNLEPSNSAPLPPNFLQPFYGVPFTHIDLGFFSMCTLDDDALDNLSAAMPNLESLILGTRGYWSAPPRASLAGISSVLRNCRGLKQLGLVFNCSIGALDFGLLPVNKAITALSVGVSSPNNPHLTSIFLSRALPNLTSVRIECLDPELVSKIPKYLADRFERAEWWRGVRLKA